MRVKVRKPAKNKKFQSFTNTEEKKQPNVNFGFGDESLDTMMDEEFGLKNGFTKESLVLDPTPAVPGKPVLSENEEPFRMREEFNEFLPSTTPIPVIPVENIKTEDFQKEDMSETDMDYPIYDTENSKPFPPIKMSEFPNMPIFSNFPMMGPNEFIQTSPTESPEQSDVFLGYTQESNDYMEQLLNEELRTFNAEDRPETINIFKEDTQSMTSPEGDRLASLVNIFNEESEIEPETRPVRRPTQEKVKSPYNTLHQEHPNHKYPLHNPKHSPSHARPTPFTVKPRTTIVPHSYIKNSYKHSNLDRFGSGTSKQTYISFYI